MIFLQVIFGISAVLLTPIVLIIFFIQSRNFPYQAGTALLLLGYSFCLMFSYGNTQAGLYVFLILFILQQIVYALRQQNINAAPGRKYVLGQIIIRESSIAFDFIVSLLPLYFIKNLPFSLIIRPGKTDMEIRLKEIIQIILEHGADTSIDFDTKDAVFKFRMI